MHPKPQRITSFRKKFQQNCFISSFIVQKKKKESVNLVIRLIAKQDTATPKMKIFS